MHTILIVDDDSSARLIAKSILESHMFEVLMAADATQARAMIEKEDGRIKAILLDWQMPGMNGIDLLRWIKDHPVFERTPVIMQTAMGEPHHIHEGIEAGAFYYLTKPIDQKVLVSIVQAAVSDAAYKSSLLNKLKECQNPFSMLVEGTFHFQTIREGELLALWIANACPFPERAMGINEIFLNGIEHGNLGITYDDKTEFVNNGTWEKEVEQRLRLSRNIGKFVRVSVTRHDDRMTVLVEDEGPGFDYERYLQFDESRVFDNHGRGIAMARTSLDLQYLGIGNTVLITIPFEALPGGTHDERRP
jgi:CheY-like chemotaxis protein